ncbi:MAG: response regulator transcription factor [Lentisphaeria bacterium]|nr:response regulator transcription factor [Lentisphaeria bacterium]
MDGDVYLLGKPSLSRALQRALCGLGFSTAAGVPAAAASGRAIILYSSREPEIFFKAVADTAKLHLRDRIIGVCIDPLPPEKIRLPPECSALPAIAEAYEKTFVTTGLDLAKLVSLLEGFGTGNESELEYHHAVILQSAWSCNLYNLIYREIAHGTKMDFTNTYLAPVSAGLKLDRENRADYFRELRSVLCRKDGISCRNCLNSCPLKHLHDKLLDGDANGGLYASSIKRCIDLLYDDPWNHKDTEFQSAVERLIEISTRIRRQSAASPYRVQTVDPAKDQDEVYPAGNGALSILLIDDHVRYWRPYFSLVAAKLDCQVFFSADGKHVYTADRVMDVKSSLPFFDIIILDIVISNTQNGFDILHEIRQILPNIPVVITSTVHEPDLADQLQSANGFIYKKHLIFKDVTNLLSTLFADGRSGKTHSLPNIFFSNNIFGMKREWTINFTRWAIKHLDGFHAVDDGYFRYFNDHGGRHMISLMGILEQLVKPFLLPADDLLGLAGERRDENILCLYLAVLCHEFGMFPLLTKCGEHSVQVGMDTYIENYNCSEFKNGIPANRRSNSEITDMYQAIRKFHGQRSMFMIMDESLQYPEFRTIFANILTCMTVRAEPVRCKIAALCGYHNRFMSLKEDDFLQKIGKQGYKLEWLQDSVIGERLNENSFNTLFQYMNKICHEESQVLRRLCAVFRFADALDVDYSRAIPQYLGHNNDDRNVIEDLKRYIVQSVDMNFGDVVLCFNLDPKQLLAIDGLPVKWRSADGKRYSLVMDRTPVSRCDDRLLEMAAETVKGRFLSVLHGESAPGKAPVQLLKNLLCITVMLEIADEYKAIKDVGLHDQLRIGDAIFSEPVVDFDLWEYYFKRPSRCGEGGK